MTSNCQGFCKMSSVLSESLFNTKRYAVEVAGPEERVNLSDAAVWSPCLNHGMCDAQVCSNDWECLPFHVISLVVAFVEKDDYKFSNARKTVGAMRLVNRHWRDNVNRSLERLLVKRTDVREVVWTIMHKFPKVKDLDVSWCESHPRDCEFLAILTNLEKLEIGETVNDDVAPSVAHLTELKDLKVLGGGLTDKGVEYLRPLTKLTYLDFACCDELVGEFHFLDSLTSLRKVRMTNIWVGSFVIEHLKPLTNLTELDLGGNPNITDWAIPKLTSLVSLKILEVWDCEFLEAKTMHRLSVLSRLVVLNVSEGKLIRNDGVSSIAQVQSLTHLDMTGCVRVGNKGLEALVSMSNLTHLDLWGVDRITNQGLAHLGKLTNLRYLALGACYKITNPGLVHLGALANLQSLRLSQVKGITDHGISHITQLTNLTNVGFDSCDKISNIGIARLTSLPKLASLGLSYTMGVNDNCLQHLGRMSSLTKLDLSSCQRITNAGVVHLTGLQNLRKLEFWFCKNVTKEGLRIFSTLPRLQELRLP